MSNPIVTPQYSLDVCFPDTQREAEFYSPDGSWLCGNGPYQTAVKRACGFDPGLHKMDVKTRPKNLDQCRSRMVVLEVGNNQTLRREDFAVTNLDQFQQYLYSTRSRTSPSGRIYILEGLNPGFVNLLGSQFDLDPSMFKRQERANVYATEHEWCNDNPTLPSSRSKAYLHLRYFEVLNFEQPLPSLKLSCADTGRHIGSATFGNTVQPNAPVRRKVTFWSRHSESGNWDAVILCDPPIVEILNSKTHETIAVKPKPFQGGYVDFIPFDRRKDGPNTGSPRSCFLEDFAYYFTTYAAAAHEEGITCASLFVKKLIAAHLLEFTSYLRGFVYYQSHLIAGKDPGVQTDDLATSKQHWAAAQGLSLRCSQYVENFEADRMELQSNLDASERQLCASSNWTNYEADYAYVYQRLKEIQRRADALTNSLGAMASIAAGRQAQDDGRRGQMFTLVGMIFIPLAYVTGIFSMADEFRPGGGQFWVYFVVAVPGVFLVMLATFLLNYFKVFERPVNESLSRLLNLPYISGPLPKQLTPKRASPLVQTAHGAVERTEIQFSDKSTA